MIFRQFQQDWIIDDAAVLIGDENIFALADLAFRQVSAAHELHKFHRIRTFDFNLTFYTDIAENGVVDEVPKILHRITKVAGNIHVVVNRKALGPQRRAASENGDLRTCVPKLNF